MNLAELLYWDTISDLASDDLGIWEVAWRANTLSRTHRNLTNAAAATVIARLVKEGLATPVDESGDRCDETYLGKVLRGDSWARASRPTPMLRLRAVEDALQRRYAEIPHHVGPEAMSRQDRVSGDISER
jgi:hypothetical protein